MALIDIAFDKAEEIWQLFLSFTHKKSWQISKSDIASWVSNLRLQNLSPRPSTSV